jgi:hypothetical protein
MKNRNSTQLFQGRILACLLVLIFLLPVPASAQRKWKEYLLTGSSMFVSGMLDGTIESISYHYDNGFKVHFSEINNQFWDPSLSWANKYKDGNSTLGAKFPGSTTVFVCTTDGYHMLRAMKRTVDGLTLAYYINNTCKVTNTCPEFKAGKKKWKNVVTDFLVLTAIRSIGFTLTYSVLFNPQGMHYKL